ncbi:precorrin-6A reductase [Sporofaciens sp. SGI.106]|uniref:precorrin-6A reductase n=1 Tax=Sporofaciens sp. SGI.106 TaxID=3420568 RepID=UPI003D06E189
MKLIIISFTRQGNEKNRILREKMEEQGYSCEGYAPARFAGAEEELSPLPEDIRGWIGTLWGECGFLFIGAAGIAVRMTAPWVKDKFTDSPVLVMDEKAGYVIPLLSGHVGGAVEIARDVSACVGAVPVVTTATDVQGKFAIDVFAKKNDLVITDRVLAKKISAALLEGENPYQIEIAQHVPDSSDEEDSQCLTLLPKNVIVGIGCRKNCKKEKLEAGLDEILSKNRLRREQIRAVVSIDLKKDELGLVALCRELRVPFLTYTKEELLEVEEVSSRSEFVAQVTGVDNVCERAVKRYMSGKQGMILQEKVCLDEMTVAVGCIKHENEEQRNPENGMKTGGVLVFAGTTEGRRLAEFLGTCSGQAYVSVATEYGKTCVGEYPNVQVICGRMNRVQMETFMREHQIFMVIDATHPYAVEVTRNIREACECVNVPYLRCLRQEKDVENEELKDVKVLHVESVEEAVQYLEGTEGNILIATGSKELGLYTQIKNYRERCYARVLSVRESVEKAISLGFEGSHLIAMQGPFSEEMNLALLKQTRAEWFVTKESGKTGGFGEKVWAAKQSGATLVVIGRPKEEGMTVEEICRQFQKIYTIR